MLTAAHKTLLARIAIAVVAAGLALLLGSIWPLVAALPLWLLMHYGVVLREEAYLLRRFGQEYARYQQHAPRWL